MNIDLEYIKSLISLASQYNLTELKVSSADKQVVIKKEKETHVAHAVTPIAAVTQTPVSVADTAEHLSDHPDKAEPADAESKPVEKKRGTPVKSPMVGTFYRAPSPESPPFVEVGQKVKVGQVLCIIESMKLMNEIESEIEGTITEICVENAEPVEADTILMYIE